MVVIKNWPQRVKIVLLTNFKFHLAIIFLWIENFFGLDSQYSSFLQVLDSVLSKILMCAERPSVATGLALLDLCLAFEPADPLILSALLSCISALFVFLSMAPPETSSVSCYWYLIFIRIFICFSIHQTLIEIVLLKSF